MPTGHPKSGINKGWFKKGVSNPLSEETKRKISKSNKGKKKSEEHKLKLSLALKGKGLGNKNPFYGKQHSVETKKKISLKNKGKKPWNKQIAHSPETRKKISEALKKKFPNGRQFSLETKLKISNASKRLGLKPPVMRGENNYNWKGGITPINEKIRKSLEYKEWRTAIFKRDNYTCVWCGIHSGLGKAVTLQADHIKPFALYPELRLIVENGRTLCENCHKKTDTFAGKIKNYKII